LETKGEKMNKSIKIFKNVKQKLVTQSLLNSVYAILFGFLVGFLIMLIVNPSNALPGFGALLTAVFRSSSGFGNVLFKAAPLILVGLSVGFAFKTGLFNIGASGQFMIGGVAALYVANLLKLPVSIQFLHFPFAVLAAIIAGAIWGSIPGILKAFYNVSEVIATIMMNYIGMLLSMILVYNPRVYDSGITGIKAYFPTAHTPTFGLNEIGIFKGSNLDISILIAVAVAIFIWIILNKSTLGYQLKAVGYSTDASKYAGINYKKNIIVSMCFAGGLAGLAAALNYLPIKPDYFSGTTKIVPYGFDGISVAFIGQSNPIGIIFSGIFISYVKQGSLSMQLYGYDKEIANIVMSAIIYTIAISTFIGTYLQIRKVKALKRLEEKREGDVDV